MKKKIYRFFWWFAGAHIRILEQHETEYQIQFHIGLSVLITTVLAFISGTYAANFIFMKGDLTESSPFYTNYVAIIFGILWSIIILNIDRYIVCATRKEGTSLYETTPYEKFIILRSEIISASPRIILAVVIAITISTPVELYIFKDQIDYKVSEINLENIKNSQNNAKTFCQDRPIIKEISEIEKEKEKIEKEYNDITNKLSRLIKRKQENLEKVEIQIHFGDPKNNIPLGYGRLAKSHEDAANLAENEIEKITPIKDDLENKINSYRDMAFSKKMAAGSLDDCVSERTVFLKEKYESSGNGLVNRVEALLTIGSDSGNSYYNLIRYFIILIIALVELIPVSFKLLSPRSSYDAEINKTSMVSSIENDSSIILTRKAHQNNIKKAMLSK